MLKCIAPFFLALAICACATVPSPWSESYDSTTKSRFIPVELWTGAAWDGTHELKMSPADLTFGGTKRIVGPVAWKRPNGETVQVYVRENRGKLQRFTLSSRGDGLGRVSDSRYERDCRDEVKFPLGTWKEGESRTFEVPCNDGRLLRRIVVTIERLDYVHLGVPHSLRFHWVVDGGNSRGTDMRYVYSPGRGLVSVEGD
jgi:hypothetical protein